MSIYLFIMLVWCLHNYRINEWMLNDTPARKLHRLSKTKVRMAFDRASNNFIYLLPNTASCGNILGNIRQRKYPNNFRVHQRTNSLREMFYTLFHELFSTFFFSNIIGLPERRNKRKSVLKIVKKAPPFKKCVNGTSQTHCSLIGYATCEWMNEWMFNDTPAQKQIGYWVSNKWFATCDCCC